MLPEALKNMFEKPATEGYPANRGDVFPNMRGKLNFEADKCVGCKLCSRDCPTGALTIEKIGDKQFKAVLRLDKCIYCGQCADSCNKSALSCTHEFELASLSQEDLKVEL